MHDAMNSWVAISGSWRHTPPKVIEEVQKTVIDVLGRGRGIVTGGALGVDQVATETTLRIDPSAEYLIVILPTSLETYATHYRNRAVEGVITAEQAEALIALLEDVKRRRADALVELSEKEVDAHSYGVRNTAVVEMADELVAFHVNGTAGTQDAIDKARALDKPVDHKELEKELRELRRANEILKLASAFFARELDPPSK